MKKTYIEIKNEKDTRLLMSEIIRETKIGMQKELASLETSDEIENIIKVVNFKDGIVFNKDKFTVSINGINYIDVYRLKYPKLELEDDLFDDEDFIKASLRSYLLAVEDAKNLQYVPPLHDDIYTYLGEYCDSKLVEYAKIETDEYINDNPEEFKGLSGIEFDEAYERVFTEIHEGYTESYFGFSSYDLEYRLSKVLDMYELSYIYEAPVGLSDSIDYYLKMTNISMKSFLNIDYKNPSPLEIGVKRE